jgi:type IX secretion system PorP/SprF family membrane protein
MQNSTCLLQYISGSCFHISGTPAKAKLISSLLLLLCSLCCQAQDPYFSQFYASAVYLNPALVGVEKDMYFGINYRSQWTSLGTPFTTGQFSFSTPLGKNTPINLHRNGLGITVYTDVAGENKQFRSNGVSVAFAHDIVLGADFNQVISFGGQAGLIQKRVDYTHLQWGSQYDPSVGFNPGLVSSAGQFAEQLIIPTLSYGVVWYLNPRKNDVYDGFSGFVGFAASNLNRPNESMLTSELNRLPILYKLHGGAEWQLSQNFAISPNFLAMQQNNVRQFNIGSYLTYKTLSEKSASAPFDFMLGGWYRVNDSFIFSTGVQAKKYSIGLSYDLNVSTLRHYTYGKGAYEISIAYRISKETQIRRFSTPLM